MIVISSEGNEEKAPSRGWREMLGFFIFISLFVSTICAGIGVVMSVLYTADSTIEWQFIIGSVLFAMILILTQFITHMNHSRPMFPLYLLSSFGLAVFFYSFLISMVIGIFLLALLLTGIPFHDLGAATVIRMLPILLLISLVLYGAVNARYLRRRKERLPVLHRHGEVKVALISDLHLGLLVGKTRLNAIMRTLKEERPDIIVIAGDFIDTNPRHLGRFGSFVRELVSSAPVYAVTGNHEFYNGMGDSMGWLGSFGVKILDNRSVKDPVTGIRMIGIHDPSAFKDGDHYKQVHSRLLEDIREEETTILVNHQPVLFHKAAEMGVDLQLSGHTHAGQVWPFGLGTKAMFREGDRGLHRWKDSFLYVCQGTGTWGPPMRIGTTSEMIILELFEKK